MKKLLLTLVGVLAALSPAFASLTAAFNVSDRGATISARGVQALYDVAKAEPGSRVGYEQGLGTPLVEGDGDISITNSFVIPEGRTYMNSGLDANRKPVQHPSIAKENIRIFAITSKRTTKTIFVKDVCMNLSMVVTSGVPSTSNICETTWNINEVDIRISLTMVQSQNNNQQLTASATTGPISIVFNNVTASAPLMVGGGNNPNQFYVTRDSRGLMSLGYTIGGQTKIYNTNIANGGAGGSVGPITNNNANSNVNANANNTVVNTGSGSASGSAAGSGSGTAKAGGG